MKDTIVRFRGTRVAFIVYDISARNTFLNVPNWAQELLRFSREDTFVVVVGNKSDTLKREVTASEGRALACQILPGTGRCIFLETSCKSGRNVDIAFLAAVKYLHLARHPVTAYSGTPAVRVQIPQKGPALFRKAT